MNARVLVVDDDPAVRSAIARALRVDYDVDEAADGAEALAQQAPRPADAIVLDLLMPEIGGLDVCRSLRRREDPVPILVVTARDAVDDRVEGLDAGADDYLVKPFAVEELRARVRALLRRTGAGDGALRFADVTLDPATREVHRGERRLQLTRTEFNLLELFMRNPRQVLTRSQIYERVWGYDFGATSNALWVYIGYLRRKLEEGGEPRLLHTVRGVGYALREEPVSFRTAVDAADGARDRRDGRGSVARGLGGREARAVQPARPDARGAGARRRPRLLRPEQPADSGRQSDRHDERLAIPVTITR